MMTVAALGSLWVARVRQQSNREEAAVKTVLDLGGGVSVRYEIIGYSISTALGKEPPLAPPWLRTIIGEGSFRREVSVSLNPFPMQLGVGASRTVDDVLMPAIADLTDLERLYLTRTSRLTDAGLEHLAGMENLEQLDVQMTGITGPGLRHLRSLDSLEGLTLSRTLLEPGYLHHLAELPNLGALILSHTRIGDDDLAAIAPSRSIERLHLDYTNVTDAGLVHLEQMPALKDIQLHHTQVTPAGVARLQAAQPNCRVRPTVEDLQSKTETDTLQRIELELWPPDVHPSRKELLAKIAEFERHISVSFHEQLPGKPICFLQVRNADISAETLLRLMQEMPELEYLRLVNCPLGEDFFPELSKWPFLTYLELSGDGVTDDVLSQVSKLQGLRDLRIRSDDITDSGLQQLAPLKSLMWLYLTSTPVSTEAIFRLQEELPRTRFF